jgi:hypothetical protein
LPAFFRHAQQCALVMPVGATGFELFQVMALKMLDDF